MSTLQMRLFGVFDIRIGDDPLPPLRSRKGHHLLALLALRAGRQIQRDFLAGTLWPESAQAQAYYNLRRCLTDLRQALGVYTDRIQSPSPHTLLLDPHDVFLDVLEFDAALKRGGAEGLRYAVELYRGPLLEDCTEEWAISERQARQGSYIAALEALAADAAAQGDFSTTARDYRQLIATDPLSESAYRGLMQALAANGEHAAAILVYRNLRLMLRGELNADPSPETQELLKRIRAESAQRMRPSAAKREIADLREIRGEAGDTTESAFSEEEPMEAAPSLPQSVTDRGEGPVPLGSPYYIVRQADGAFMAALAEYDSIVLVKGARQMGKTSLLARGLQQARERGVKVVLTDFDSFTSAQLASSDILLRSLAADLADQLDLPTLPDAVWSDQFSGTRNLERYLRREALGSFEGPFVWALDEVDRLFSCDFASDVFGLFRSWHNRRSLDPGGPWSRLTLALSYATEAHLFITDANQSPFNVGTRLALEDFTREEVEELNRRYGALLQNEGEIVRYYALLQGHPYLVRRGLTKMTTESMDLQELERRADRDDGPFADHLRRLLNLLARDKELTDMVCSVLMQTSCLDQASFYRLRSAGILAGEGAHAPRMRCMLYQAYFARHLL
ncbi:MAG TPA: AAA-like domain-containing protein [Chthonomonadaceae bacterium]|nr:AAA-like domain-containing protein [Chthonomonadaceae bacterium]